MRDYIPAIIRYSIGILIVVVTALDVLGILLLAIGLVHKIILQDSPPTVSTVFTVGAGVLETMTSTPFLIALCVTSVIGTIIGQKKYGSLSQFCAAVIKYTDGVLGYTLLIVH